MQQCFVIQPFDSDEFDRRYEETYEPAIRNASFTPYRVDRDPGASIPIERIEVEIRRSRACFADITTDNPNVWFEVGFALAKERDMCFVCRNTRDRFPFDVQHRKIIKYNTGSPSDFEKLGEEITQRLKAILASATAVEHALEIRGVTNTGGLEAHEIAVLSVAMSESVSTGGMVDGVAIQRALDRAGFTELAAALGLEKLCQMKYMTKSIQEGYNDEPYAAYYVQDTGKQWLLGNTNQLRLQHPPRASMQERFQDDIPF